MATPLADAVAAIEALGEAECQRLWEECNKRGSHDVTEIGRGYAKCNLCRTVFYKRIQWFPQDPV